MQDIAFKLHIRMNLIKEEDGQDLVEYAFVFSLIAFAAIAGMNSLASGINTAFSNLASTFVTTV